MSHSAVNKPGEVREWRSEGLRNEGLLANWRIIAFTFYIGMGLFVYGFDKGAIAGFQAMPGFLEVFGYKKKDGTWDIEVCICTPCFDIFRCSRRGRRFVETNYFASSKLTRHSF